MTWSHYNITLERFGPTGEDLHSGTWTHDDTWHPAVSGSGSYLVGVACT